MQYTEKVVIGFIVRSVWRLIVLALGVTAAYWITFVSFPYLDRQLPFFVALVITYMMVAYFALPTLIRTWRIIIRPNHIPLYVTTRDGLPSDPVNIAIVAKSRRQFIKAMKQAGWFAADKATFRNTLREAYAILFDKPYPTAPFSSLYLFNRPFDIGFQKHHSNKMSPRSRHHVRFWRLSAGSKDHGHSRFWTRRLKQFIGREKTIWIGAATEDVHPRAIRWYNLQLTHRTHPLHHRERDYIIDSLKKAGYVNAVSTIKAGKPFEMRSQQIGNSFVCDGRLTVVEL